MTSDGAEGRPNGVRNGPVVIEASGIRKTFRIPTHRIDSFKERMVHPLARPSYRELAALRDISFEIHRGEFFGIVGRNGSGKSTLLKILASIYSADAGSIRMAGRVAPFIELGVGFNPDLTARENVTLNGVMMGLSQREARGRLDAVLEFAELEEFVDLKLKNYSSGMMVRLAFSVMLQAEADILLIDEVLAVGDASFQQKCRDVFAEMKDEGRTLVLVTHDMTAVQRYCHRAMLLDAGRLSYIGDPEEAGRQYLRRNFEKRTATIEGRGEVTLVPDFLGRVERSWLEDEKGEEIANVELRQPIRVCAVIEARQDLLDPSFGLHFNNPDGVCVFEVHEGPDERRGPMRRGEQARLELGIENPLMPGRYAVVCWVRVMRNDEEVAQQPMKLLDFVVYGAAQGQGMISVPGALNVEVGRAPEPERKAPEPERRS